jgi:hypothetical protein
MCASDLPEHPGTYGKYAHVQGSVDDFLARKQEDIDLEDRRGFAPDATRVSARGKFAHLGLSSEEFERETQAEIDREDGVRP